MTVKHLLINRGNTTGYYGDPTDIRYEPVCNAPHWKDGVYENSLEKVTCKNCKRTIEYRWRQEEE